MATMITDACMNCGACEPECPVEAISEGDGICIIDPEKCTDCVGYAEKRCAAECYLDCCVPAPSKARSRKASPKRARKPPAKSESTESDIDTIARERGLTPSARYRRFIDTNESAQYANRCSKVPMFGPPLRVSWIKPSAPLLRKNDLRPDAFPRWVPLAHVSAVGELEILLVDFTSKACPVSVLIDGQLSTCAKSLDAFLSALLPAKSPA